MAFTQTLDLWCQQTHLAHRPIGFVGQRKEHKFDKDSECHRRQTKIAKDAVEPVDCIEEGLGQEIEPAKINGEVEIWNAKLVSVMIQKCNFFRAGKKTAFRGDAAPRGDYHASGVDEINLIPVGWAVQRFEGKGIIAILIWQNGRQPVFVGKANPTAGLFRVYFRNTTIGILNVVIIFLTQRFIKDAKRALMKNVDAARWGRSMTANQTIGKDRERCVQTAGDRVIKSQNVIIVDGDSAVEHKAVAIVPCQRDRCCR